MEGLSKLCRLGPLRNGITAVSTCFGGHVLQGQVSRDNLEIRTGRYGYVQSVENAVLAGCYKDTVEQAGTTARDQAFAASKPLGGILHCWISVYAYYPWKIRIVL